MIRSDVLTAAAKVVLAPGKSDFTSDGLRERTFGPSEHHIDLARGLTEEPSVCLSVGIGRKIENTDRWAVVVPSRDSADLPVGVVLVARLFIVSD
jgi:hypothetical protein